MLLIFKVCFCGNLYFRHKFVDFSFTLIHTQLQLFYPKMTNEFKWHAYLSSFHDDTWISVVCYIFSTGIVIVALKISYERLFGNNERRNSATRQHTNGANILMNTLASALNISLRAVIAKRIPSEPHQTSSRIIFFCVLFSGFVIISLYRAMLGASLAITVEKKPPVSSFEDILRLKYRIALRANTNHEKMFTDAVGNSVEDKIYQAGLLWTLDSDEKKRFDKSFSNGEIDKTMLLWILQDYIRRDLQYGRHDPDYPCKLSSVAKDVYRLNTGMIYQKNWPYTRLLNQHILKLKEDGIIDMLLNRHFEQRKMLCDKAHTRTPTKIQDAIGSFIILGIGMIVSFIIVTSECVHGIGW